MKLKVVQQELLSGCGCVRVVKVASFSYGIHIKKYLFIIIFPGHLWEYKKGKKKIPKL